MILSGKKLVHGRFWLSLLAALYVSLAGCRSATHSELEDSRPRVNASEAPVGYAPAETLEYRSPHSDRESLQAKKTLRIATYNVENMFIREAIPASVRFEGDKLEFKSERELQWVAKVIGEIAPDIAVLEEVEANSLDYFCQHYLKNSYNTLVIRGNDGRGIDVAAIVKATTPVSITYESHKNEQFSDQMYPKTQKVFSRDVVTMLVKLGDQASPSLVLMGLHGKSKRQDNPQDHESNDLRRQQGERTKQIAEYYRIKYKVPVLIAGDFNDPPNEAKAYESLRQANYKDGFEISKMNPIRQKGDIRRVTHTYHPNRGPTVKGQLDAIFVSPEGHNLVQSTTIYKYKDNSGKEISLPNTFDERAKLPSDHWPLYIDFSIAGLNRPN
jgi:predicted extracellular nuclease